MLQINGTTFLEKLGIIVNYNNLMRHMFVMECINFLWLMYFFMK